MIVRARRADKEISMLRLGIVDCDTSHSYQFSRRLNHTGIAADQWVDGARVVVAFPGSSRITDPARIEEYLVAVRDAGVTLVDRPEDLIGQVDAVLIASNEGAMHRERAMPFIAAGLPVFIDKPLASTADDARALVDMARERDVTLLSASSLRFVPELRAAREDQPGIGPLAGADVYAPAPLHPINPGLLHYGVHGVEMLYTLLGPGCEMVSSISNEGGDIVTGQWSDGRLGVLRGLRAGARGYGFTAYGSTGISATTVNTDNIYRDLLAIVVPVLAGGPPPVAADELVEVVAFQEAALQSSEQGGRPVSLKQ